MYNSGRGEVQTKPFVHNASFGTRQANVDPIGPRPAQEIATHIHTLKEFARPIVTRVLLHRS